MVYDKSCGIDLLKDIKADKKHRRFYVVAGAGRKLVILTDVTR